MSKHNGKHQRESANKTENKMQENQKLEFKMQNAKRD